MIWRGGMVGAGVWSETQLAAWAKVPDARIVALCDRHPERRQALAQRFGIARTFGDVAAMLAGAELDFVDICTRPASHAALVGAAVQRRLPILCQKPFGTSLDEARALVALCRGAGVRLMINENFRWQAWYRKAKELLDAGALGEPFLARIDRRLRITMPRFSHPQAYLKEMPDLILYEVGVHYLDTFRFLFGEPDSVFARLHRIGPDTAGEDVQLITLNYPRLTGTICNSWASVPMPGLDGPAPRIEIDGTRATLILGGSGVMRLVGDGGEHSWTFSDDTVAASHVAAQQHFIECPGTGAEFETSGEETLKTLALVYACYRSAWDRGVTRT